MAIIPTWFPSPTEELRAACEHRQRRRVGGNQISGLIQQEAEQHFDSQDEARILEALEGLDNSRAQLTVAFARLTSVLRNARYWAQRRYEQFHRAGGVTAEQYRAFLRGELDQQIPVVQNKHLRCLSRR